MGSKFFSVLGETLFSSWSGWTQKTQPNDGKAAVWLSFRCSPRPSADTGTDKYSQWLNRNPAGAGFLANNLCLKMRGGLFWTNEILAGATQFGWITWSISKFARNHWGNGFYEVLLHYYTQITPLENRGHIVWMDYKHETTKSMGFMRSFFHYYTQITPLENGGHIVWMDYKQKISEICTKPLR